jgi:isocitrate dehydrogenase
MRNFLPSRTIMKKVFDEHYKKKYIESGLIPDGKLKHLISDAATMQIIRWTKGGFGMAAHNYDGDMLTDEVAQVHRSPGFITSNLIGKTVDGTMIKGTSISEHNHIMELACNNYLCISFSRPLCNPVFHFPSPL